MGVFPYLGHPVFEILEGLSAVDGVEEEDCGDAFVEGADDGSEELLACLYGWEGTVSQICRRTKVFLSMGTILLEYSTPTVTLYCSQNYPLMYRIIRLLLPTHE
jgi:hypothetical protein